MGLRFVDVKSSDGHGGGCEGDARMAGGAHDGKETYLGNCAWRREQSWQVAACSTTASMYTTKHMYTFSPYTIYVLSTSVGQKGSNTSFVRNISHSASQISRARFFCSSSMVENYGYQTSFISAELELTSMLSLANAPSVFSPVTSLDTKT